jgi:Uncharacterised protein family (UPF0182)
MDTYAQLQEIRTYYKFHDVDVDRYELGGSYQHVMLSARELEPALASGGPVVRQPRIYFGRGTLSYVIVKTSTPEFDYPTFWPPVGGAGTPRPYVALRSYVASATKGRTKSGLPSPDGSRARRGASGWARSLEGG